MKILNILFAPLTPFVFHPGRIAFVGITFFVAAVVVTTWRRKMVWAPFLAAIAWAFFAAWEQHCVAMRYNIRVDLGLVYPLMVAFTIYGILGLLVFDRKHIEIPRQFSLRTALVVMTLVALLLGLVVWFVH